MILLAILVLLFLTAPYRDQLEPIVLPLVLALPVVAGLLFLVFYRERPDGMGTP